MKKKVLVILTALVLVVGMVGSCFALYSKDATQKTITLTTGDSVTLTMTGDSLALENLNPDTNKTYAVTLSASNTALLGEGAGEFKVTIAASSADDADLALAANIGLSASDGAAFSATKSELAAGVEIDFDDLPEAITLTFYIGEEAFLTGAAEGSVDVTLSWKVVEEEWTIDTEAYYIVGSMNGWSITSTTTKLSTAAADIGESGNHAVLRNVAFTAGDEFKIRKGDGTWYSLLGGAAVGNGVSIGTGESNGNCVVGTTGTYCIYQNGSGFYVGPYPEV